MKNTYNQSKIIKEIVVAGIFMAMITALTTISMPIPGGYIHLGDSMVYACAWAVGGVPAIVASAVGSMLADIIIGYPQYAVATLIIKALMCIVCYLIMKKMRYSFASNIFGPLAAAVVLVVGYCAFEYLLSGPGGAMAVLYPNIMQGIGGVILGNIIINTLNKIKAISPYIKWKERDINE